MIVVIGGTKGGTGKSTITVHMAVLQAQKGRKVLLVDTDPQKSSTIFTSVRSDEYKTEDYTCINLYDKEVAKQVRKLANNYDDIVIDVAGSNSVGQRSAMLVADKILTPVNPSAFDIWSVAALSSIVEEVKAFNEKVKWLACVNQGKPTGKDNQETLDFFKEVKNVSILKSVIKQRVAFKNSILNGIIVTEMEKPDPKAIQEITALNTEIFF